MGNYIKLPQPMLLVKRVFGFSVSILILVIAWAILLMSANLVDTNRALSETAGMRNIVQDSTIVRMDRELLEVRKIIIYGGMFK